MTWLVSAKQYIPAVIGEEFGGGYFAGYISHTADGNPTHALIVAPRATGATGSTGGGYTLVTRYSWKTEATTTLGATSPFDGAANTAALVTAGIANHPAANFCVTLNIGGFTDWYLPSRLEQSIAYFNLKPTTSANNTSWGVNDYSVPKTIINNTATYPSQTSLTAFNTSSEAFVADFHWTSTETNATTAWNFNFGTGQQFNSNKLGSLSFVRAFRRIAL
jgi:hypothetical protein